MFAALALVLGLVATPADTRAISKATQADTCTVEFLDIGQGDSVLITTPEGKRALIDAGPKKDVAAKLLKDRNIDNIDLLVLSHHHIDHYGGMAEVVKQFKPKVFLDSGSDVSTPTFLGLLQLIRDEG